MAVSGAAFSTGMRDMWFERQRAQCGAPSGACRRRLDQYPVWLGQVMDRACFLLPPGTFPQAGIDIRRRRSNERLARRIVPNRWARIWLKSGCPALYRTGHPTLRCNITQFATKNNALGWSFGDSPTPRYLSRHAFRRFRAPQSGKRRSTPPRNGSSPIRCRGRPASATRRGCAPGRRPAASPVHPPP